ncbi:ESPR-type extended signal peptide-containing protein [Neisseria polysaccharea]|uniref:ESPR-type extended signal peptide-containing protein n=1 Tax=Neisseria polysaccharea TaxID=489 RepID=UPI002729DC56|nr:ESPR-type extended signal peptide-containing protein [Neisseria polysaccharea]
MNKIFRVIYSQATQSWVAVSELTKAHKKQSSSSAKKSASGSSANLIKSSAIALALLSSHSAYAAAALNDAGTGSGAVAWGTGSEATATDSVAIGKGAKAENANAIAIGGASKASGDSDIALGNQAKAENKNTVAIGRESKASGESGIALGYQATADKQFTVAIGVGASSKHNNAVAIGKGSQALGATSLALVMGSKATGNDSYAIGWSSDSIGEMSMAFGRESKARKKYDIVFGAEANTRDQGQGHSIAIGVGAMSGTNSAGKNFNGGDAGGVAIGTGAYTGVNKNNISVNSSVAVGAGAGAGYRKVDTDGLPTDNATDADNNAKVLVKAFGGTTGNLAYFNNAGNANKEGFFSFQNVNINEATALGRNARAIGDQSVAIGAQSVAGQGSIVIGGNDIQAYDGKKYFKAANPNSEDAKGVNDFDAETTPGTGKNGQPIRITDKYKELVGEKLDNTYRSSYGQDGSTVIGMQAHSTTPLGVAIGTNSIVRKGAFGATAIGSGASVFANAEAAVAIGMGSQAQGNYAVAAGTAAKAKESAVAAGYQANADKSAVAVGDSSKAATSSVAVGQGAVSEKVSDIAIGQGAKAKGEQGAIAMGLGTIAQGHSSIMIGGSDISTAANQVVEYSREKVTKDGTPELYDGKITEVINGKTVTRTVKLVQTETVTGKKLSDAYREITGYYLNTLPLDYSIPDNKNGHASISMGIHSLSKGAMGVAIGTGARADALGSMALGTGAHAGMQNSVAIGTGAVADKVSKGTRQTDISYDEDGNVVETGSAKAKYTFRWAGGINTSEGDVVSFGTPGAERQLKNVAAGRVAEDSTDAVNGSQLNAITRSLSQTITNGWQVGGNNKFRMSNIGSNDRVNFLDGLGTAVNIAEINQAEDIDNNKLVKIGSDFYKASDFTTDGKLKAGAQKVAAAKIKKQPAGANVTFDVKEVNSTLSVNSVGLKVTTGEVTANSNGTMNTPYGTTKAKNAEVTAAMNAAETALLTSQTTWREKNDAYQRTELAYLAADAALTKGKEAVEAIQADIVTTQKELKTAQDILATDKAALTRAENEVQRNPNDTQKQSELNQAKEKVGGSQFVVDQREQKLAYQQATLTERQTQVSVLEQEKNKAETVRNTAKDAYDVANSDLNKKKEAFNTAKKAFVDAGANQIATVQNVADSINASGWTLQQGTSDKDLVQPGDKVAFVDGNGTTVTVTTDAEKKRSEIKFDVDTAALTTDEGKVKAPDVKALKEAVTEAERDVTANPADAAKQKALADARAALAKEENKVVTAQNVAEAINDAYWIAAASGNGKNGTEDNVKAGTKVTFDAGKNIEIDHSTANKFTFKIVDNPVFTTVQIGGDKGPKITSNGDNLKVTKADGKSSTKITNVANGSDDNDAVNVSQLKASGWKVAGNNKTEVDTINPSEQVNFLDGSGTTVTVEKDKGANGKENGNVNVKYDVKLGNGLDKDTGGNITVKADGNSITVSSNGIKVNTDNKTITVGTDGTVKAVTGTIETVTAANKTEKAGQVRVADAEKGKLATVDTVAQAVNSAKWMAKATNTDAEIADTDKTNDKTTAEGIAAGDEVTFTAGKNLRVKRDGKNFTFATDKDVSFDSVKVGAEDTAANGKKPVSLTTEAATSADNNQTAPTTALNISSGTGTDAKPT